ARPPDLLGPGPLRGLVPHVVGPLPAGRPRRPLRPDARPPPRRPTRLARAGTDDPVHPPAASGPCLAGYPLQLDRGHGHPRRAQPPGLPPPPVRAPHRARAAAPRRARAGGPPRPPAAPPGVPRTAGPGLQPAPRGRSRRAGLPEGGPSPLLHLG